MLVWVLIITMTGTNTYEGGPNYRSGASVAIIDRIQTADSCEQLARVVRKQIGVSSAVCAPVRKVLP